jgi:hypothetical protein
MTSYKKINELRVIPLIIFLTSSFLIIFTYISLSDIPLISSILKDYLISGNSFFFPTLPTINIFWFLPKKFQTLPITIGQFIDLIIILNLTCYVESIIYHYIKWTILNRDPEGFFCYFLSYNNRNSEMCEETGLLQDLSSGIFRDYIRNSSDNYKLDWKNNPNYTLGGKKKFRSWLDHKEYSSGPFKLAFNIYFNYHLIFCYHFVFAYFWTIRLKFRYSPPDLNIFADFVEHKGGKAILKIDVRIFFKIYVREKYESYLLLKEGI